MKTSTAAIIIVVILLIAGGAWWYVSQNPSTAAPQGAAGINGSVNQGNLGQADNGTPQQPGGSTTQGDGTNVSQNLALGTNVSQSVGTYLTAFNGMTVYTYAPDTDTPGKSNCTGSCSANWPPYSVPAGSTLNLQSGVNGTVGTIVRDDGTTQVTYNGKPLYFYIKDTTTSDTNGQGVGGVWYVATP